LLTIRLPEEIERQLHRWAELANQSEEEIVCRALESYLAIPPDLRDELGAWQQLSGEAIEKVAPAAHEAW
jgi:predicted transcriptional regulator